MVKNRRSNHKTLKAMLMALRFYMRQLAPLLNLRPDKQRSTPAYIDRQQTQATKATATKRLSRHSPFEISSFPNYTKRLKTLNVKNLLLLTGAVSLGTLAVFTVAKTNQTHRFYDVKFPSGAISFADKVVAYEPIVYFDGERANVEAPFNRPLTALGAPNSSNLQHPLPSVQERDDVALGIGGSLTLQFTDNLLTGDGSSSPDLWIFEAGGVTESVLVEISQDGKIWHAVGKTTRDESGIDLDAFGWGAQDFFSYVRLTDNPQEGEHAGVWRDGEWLGWGGANIDAVGAISSASFERSAPEILSSPTSAYLVFFGLLVFVTGLGVGYFLKRKRNG